MTTTTPTVPTQRPFRTTTVVAVALALLAGIAVAVLLAVTVGADGTDAPSHGRASNPAAHSPTSPDAVERLGLAGRSRPSEVVHQFGSADAAERWADD